MKFDTIGRVTKALIVSLALGLGATACSRDFTLAYLYVTTAKSNPGLINAYDVDYQSGALLPIADSPIPSGGDNPVAIVAAPNGKYLYVIHRNDSNVVEFAIGTDGKLYAQHTYNVQAASPPPPPSIPPATISTSLRSTNPDTPPPTPVPATSPSFPSRRPITASETPSPTVRSATSPSATTPSPSRRRPCSPPPPVRRATSTL